MEIKAIIFDWSGVVKDALTSQHWLVNQIFKKYGLEPLSLEKFKADWEQPYQLFYNKYLPNLSMEEEEKDYLEAMRSKECPPTQSVPGMAELVRTLKEKGCFLAVVSSDHPETILKEIKEYGLENVFTEIITNVHDKFESAKDLLQKYDLDRKETYFIGDSNHEADVAKRLGIKSIAVTWGLCNVNRLKSVNPDFLINNVKELENILL